MKKSLFALFAVACSFQLATEIATASPEIGQPAPAFTLTDTSGTSHNLSDFKGKTVVLEWVNHGCPFVVKHYASGNMQKLQEAATADGIVWLSICSSAPGKQGHMSAEAAATKSKEVGSKATAYLLDEDGKVGQAYGAKVTPELFIINPEGILVYKGAIDDKKSTDAADIPNSKNFVSQALAELKEGQPVSEPVTAAYGCSVKY
jgi:peroxiredoxin